MKIVQPQFEVIYAPEYSEVLRVLEVATRTAYKSEDKIGPGSAEKLLRNVLDRKPTPHESVIEHMGFTLKFVCDRGVSHELVRPRLCAFTQESTRYCNYSKGKFLGAVTFVAPEWYPGDNADKASHWVNACEDCEQAYFDMLGAGFSPQAARAVLPNSLKTEVVMTANFRQWRHVFRLRTHTTAHTQMRQLMRPALSWARNRYPLLFEGIGCLGDAAS